MLSLTSPIEGAVHWLVAWGICMYGFGRWRDHGFLLSAGSDACNVSTRSDSNLSKNWTAPETVSLPSPWITLFRRCHDCHRINMTRFLHYSFSEERSTWNQSVPVILNACSLGISQCALVASLSALLLVHAVTAWYSLSLSTPQISHTSSFTIVLLKVLCFVARDCVATLHPKILIFFRYVRFPNYIPYAPITWISC